MVLLRYGLAMVIIFCFAGSGLSQTPADSVRAYLNELPPEKRIDAFQKLIISLWLNYPDSAMTYAVEAMEMAVEEDNTRYKAIANRMMGGIHSYKGNYDSSLYYNRLALNFSQAINDTTLTNNAMSNVGLAYYHLGDYPAALENMMRSLKLKYAIRQDYGLGINLNNVGLVHTKLKDYDEARKYLNEAMAVSIRLKDDNIRLYSMNNIGFTYLYEGNLPKAQACFEASLKIARTVDNTNWHAAAFSGLAQVYFAMNRVPEAKQLFNTSLGLRQKIGDKNGISEVYFFLSKIYATTGNLDSAFAALRMSEFFVSQTRVKDRRLENFDLFTTLYTMQKKYDSALYYQAQYITLRDSLFNENQARNLADIQLKMKEEETQQQLAEKDLQLQKRTMLTNFLTALLILFLIFSGIIYWYYRTQKRLGHDLAIKNTEIFTQKEEIQAQKEALVLSNSELEKAHKLIQEKNRELAGLNQQLQSTVDIRTRELEIANRELRIVNLELDNFIYKSSHDIKGPLVRLLGICHVALLDTTDERARSYLTMLNDTAKHLNDIFDRLKVVSNINSLEIEKAVIDFDRILFQVKRNLRSLEGYEQIDIQFEADPDLSFYSDPFLIETIFHNMIENAVRFQNRSTEGHKFIRIRARRQGGQSIIISFTDNGIGIKQTDVDHIFKMFSQAALEHHTVGLGLYIVKQCVNKLGGSVSIVRSNQKFTQFEVLLSA